MANSNKAVEYTVATPLPLECLRLDPSLDGSHGANRNTGNGQLITADNDLVAISTWLDEFKDSPQTFRHYRKEIERLLLWCVIECRQPFSSLKRDDIHAYEIFLNELTVDSPWCGARKPRTHPQWKPFMGPLSEASIQQSLTVIGAAFGYLSDAGYLLGNPVGLLRRRKKRIARNQPIERVLSQAMWRKLWEYVERLPSQSLREQENKTRVRFLFALLYLLGPRVKEVSDLRMNSFVHRNEQWWCKVLGKGQRLDAVPVNSDMLSALIVYRRTLDLDDLPNQHEDSPLLRSIKGTSGVTANMIYRIVKNTLNDAATAIEPSEPATANTFRRASTHWFRHTAITHQADKGIELRHLKKSARHNDINTTSRYLHAEDDAWFEDMAKHKL